MGNALLTRCPLCKSVGAHEVVRTEPADFYAKAPDSNSDAWERYSFVISSSRVRIRACQYCGEQFQTREIPEDMLFEAYVPLWAFADLKKKYSETQHSTNSDNNQVTLANVHGGVTYETLKLVELMHKGFSAADTLETTQPTKAQIFRNLSESILSVLAIVIRHRICTLDPEMESRVAMLKHELETVDRSI